MDKQTNKRSFLEVYSLEEEETADVNKLQEEFENKSTLSTESIDSESADFNNNVALRLEIGFYVYLQICALVSFNKSVMKIT